MSATPDGADTALLALRAQIDAVDRELLALLNRRAALALEVGELKKQTGGVVFRPEREAQVIQLYYVEELNLEEIGEVMNQLSLTGPAIFIVGDVVRYRDELTNETNFGLPRAIVSRLGVLV